MLKLLILIATFWTIYLKAGVIPFDHQRDLTEGEKVIFNLSVYEVQARSSEKQYLIRSLADSHQTLTASREKLAITDGCLEEICVQEMMFDVKYMRHISIVGITFQGDFIAESPEAWSGFYLPLRPNMAKTEGCHELIQNLCIGSRVKDGVGNTMIVIALQQNGHLVLKSNDGWNSYRSFVDPQTVAILP